jgi:acyl-CoA thioester hydrolase
MDGFPFSCSIQVRWSDLDAFGHVNNATVASYLEMARTDAWLKLFGDREPLGIPFFVKRLEIDYRRPIDLEDDLRVGLRVTEIRGASLIFEYRVEAGAELAATATTRLACVDKKTGRPVPIDPGVRKILRELVVD